jgi:hypothetical protein
MPMRNRYLAAAVVIGGMMLAPLGCAMVRPKPPATMPGMDAAAENAANAERRRVFADLTGGNLGAGGGYLIGVVPEKVNGSAMSPEAIAASRRAEESPARPEDVRKSNTADLNGDGFVTLDELVAMRRAGLTDREMINRLHNTGALFLVTPEQERYLTDRGMSGAVVSALEEMNHQSPNMARVAGEKMTTSP